MKKIVSLATLILFCMSLITPSQVLAKQEKGGDFVEPVSIYGKSNLGSRGVLPIKVNDEGYLYVNMSIRGVEISRGEDVIDAGTLRVTIATDDDAVTSLGLLDNAVDGNYHNVNLNIQGADAGVTANEVIVAGSGTAGSADAAVVTIQGVSSMTEVEVDITEVNGSTHAVSNPIFAAIGDGAKTIDVGTDEAGMAAIPEILPVGGEYRIAQDTYTDGDAAVQHMSRDGSQRVDGSTVPPYTHSSARGDFTCVYASTTTLTVAGAPTLTNDQLAAVVVTNTGGTAVRTFVNGLGGVVLTTSSNVITIVGAGTPFASGDVINFMVNLQDKAFDADLDSQKNIIQNPIWNRYTDKEALFSTAYELTASFADVGGEIDMRGYNQLTLWLTIDIGTSTNPQLRVLFKHTTAGAEEYREIYLGSPSSNLTAVNLNDYEIDSDADQLFKINIPTSGTVAFVQLQAKDAANGDGQIDAAYVTKAWSD